MVRWVEFQMAGRSVADAKAIQKRIIQDAADLNATGDFLAGIKHNVRLIEEWMVRQEKKVA